MSSGNRAHPSWFPALAGIQAGIVGSLILLAYLALDAGWHSRSVWTIPNLLSCTFYGESAYIPGFGSRTGAGLALLLFIYGLLGALFGLVTQAQRKRTLVTVWGVIFAVIWFFLSFRFLWRFIDPMVPIYSPDRAMLAGHFLYGAFLGRLFPAYLQTLRGDPVLPVIEPAEPQPHSAVEPITG